MPYPYNYPNYSAFNPASYIPQNFNSQPVQPPTPPQTPVGGVTTPSGYLCRPVTSRLEAEAVQVDFLGPGTVLPDLAHGAIYLKRFNPNTGSSDFLVFNLETPAEPAPPPQYVTADIVESLRGEIDSLKGEIEAMKKAKKVVKKNDEYDE